MAGKTTSSAGKTRSEASKSESKIPRTYRKSPARADISGDVKSAPKSPRRVTDATKSPMKPKSPARRSPSRKSPARDKSPTRKSPARDKSPTRKSPARDKSPTRKSPARDKSPTRKSPARDKSPTSSPARGRPRKVSTEQTSEAKSVKSSKQASSTPANKSKPVPVLTIDSDSDSDYSPDLSEKPKARVQGRTRRATDIGSKLIEAPVPLIVPRASREDSAMRRSARLYNTNNERTVHLKSHYEPIVKLSEFSDEDDLVYKTNKVEYTTPRNALSKGAVFGNVVFGMLFPALMLVLNAICTEKVCKFHIPTLAPYRKLSTYYNPMVFIASLGYFLLITVLTVLPIGGRFIKGLPTNTGGQLTYCMNGLFVAAIALGLAITAQFYSVPLLPFVRQHWMQFNVTFMVFGIVVAIILYIKGRSIPLSQRNPQGMTTSAAVNFFEGREVNPRFFGIVDVKYVMFRIAIITFLLLNVFFTYASLSQPAATTGDDYVRVRTVPIWPLSLILSHINIQPTILTLATIQLIYCLDLLVFERTIISSYEIQYAGTGLLKCFELLGGIFTYALVGRYVFDNNVRLDLWRLVLSALLFSVGYVLYRGSNLQKHTFRVNPYNPRISHYESIPTSTGRKLLVSGFWGFVRHPNYLGDILIHLSLLPFVCCAPPCIVVYATILGLLARACADNARCKSKYGPSWDRYCQRVKYILLPKVY